MFKSIAGCFFKQGESFRIHGNARLCPERFIHHPFSASAGTPDDLKAENGVVAKERTGAFVDGEAGFQLTVEFGGLYLGCHDLLRDREGCGGK